MAEDLQLNEQQQQLVLNHTIISSSSSSSSSTSSTPSSALFSSEPSIVTDELSAPSTTAGVLRVEVHAPAAAAVNRCVACRKRVGLTGFKCRCGMTFCGTHRYPERHVCGFDYKVMGKDQIARANPVVKAEKLRKI